MSFVFIETTQKARINFSNDLINKKIDHRI